MRDERHSEAYFGESRDFWWNPDFLALMARRWNLAEARQVLDVGCGVGHWSRTLAPHLPPDASIVGIDREPDWVAEATRRASSLGGPRTFRFMQGLAERLPFPDASFDFVTCQTVLMHVADPSAVLREMVRVLRPGGRIAVAEPNNAFRSVVRTSENAGASIDRRIALVRFQVVCEAGKMALGEGDNSVGDLVPGLLARAGLVDLSVYLNDRAKPLVPPYASQAERAAISEVERFAEREFWIWSKTDTARYFAAGGGIDAEFGPLWDMAMEERRAAIDAIRGQRLDDGGAGIVYLVSGLKPAQ